MKKFFDLIYPQFEKAIILIVTIAVMIAITYAALTFFFILIKTISVVEPVRQAMETVEKSHAIGGAIEQLQSGLYAIFGGFLLILLGLELISTVRSFAENSHIKIESVIAIAIIATSRHLVTLDYHHVDPLVIFGAGFVVLALIIGYFLVKIGITSKGTKIPPC